MNKVSWQDYLEEALTTMSVSTFRSLAVCENYYEYYADPDWWEEQHGKKPEPSQTKEEAIGCMLDNLHDKGTDERAEDLAEMVRDLVLKYESAIK